MKTAMLVLIFWLRVDATTHDKQAIAAKWNNVFNDGGRQVVLADLPQDQLISDPSIKAWRIVVLGAQLERLGVDLSNVSKAKFDTWKNNPGTLDNPAWFVADAKNCDGTPEGVKAAWQAMQSENGLEPIPDN